MEAFFDRLTFGNSRLLGKIFLPPVFGMAIYYFIKCRREKR